MARIAKQKAVITFHQSLIDAAALWNPRLTHECRRDRNSGFRIVLASAGGESNTAIAMRLKRHGTATLFAARISGAGHWK